MNDWQNAPAYITLKDHKIISDKTIISFISNHTAISAEDIRIIKHSRNSLLFDLEESKKKKETSSSFNVTMGRYNGAELCELIGNFTQSVLQVIMNKEAMGLYRDDGFIFLQNENNQKTENFRKKVIQVFKENGFSIDIMTNVVEINFLERYI